MVLDDAEASDDGAERFPLLFQIRPIVPVPPLRLVMSVVPTVTTALVPIALTPAPQSLSARARPSRPLEIQTNS